ncbi:MAG: DUF3313 family protein [Cellvibrionaceae bacterium]
MKYQPSGKIFLAAGLTVLLAACASDPSIDQRVDAKNDAGLYPVENSRLDEMFVDIETDFKGFTQVYVAPLDTSIAEVDYDADVREWRSRDWQLSEKDKTGLTEMFEQSVSSKFDVTGVSLVDEPGAGVLVVEPTLKKLEPAAPKDTFSERDPGSKYFSEGAGKVTLAFDFKDGGTGKLIATAMDRRDAGTEWQRNTAIHNRWEVQRLFNRWVSMFDQSLERIQQQ